MMERSPLTNAKLYVRTITGELEIFRDMMNRSPLTNAKLYVRAVGEAFAVILDAERKIS